eukprot:gene17505-9124_t
MARKNMEKERELQITRSKPPERIKMSSNNVLQITGENPLMSQKGLSSSLKSKRHQRSISAPLSTNKPPKSQVGLLLDKNASSHKEEIQLDPEKYDLAIDLEDISGSAYREEDGNGGWFLNPVHRPNENSLPFSEIMQRKPLTASVMKATAEGTLARDYEEDISQTPLEEFDLDIFKQTDLRTYREEIRRSLGLRSPFELELARLKQEKLKLEEAYLLKLKCDAELEETRGPKPRWYELKTKTFSREIRKHNNLLSNSENWRDLVEYRNQLIEASGRWENLRQ